VTRDATSLHFPSLSTPTIPCRLLSWCVAVKLLSFQCATAVCIIVISMRNSHLHQQRMLLAMASASTPAIAAQSSAAARWRPSVWARLQQQGAGLA